MATPEPDPADKVSGPRSRKGAQTRARLLAAAKTVFERSGFLDARISDIAEEAGLSHGSFYHYFDSKEEIFREVAATIDEQLSAPMVDVILDPESTASPLDRIREAIRRHMISYREEAQIMGVIEQVSRYDEHMKSLRLERHNRHSEQFIAAIKQLQDHGMADPDLDPVIAAAALGSMTTRFPELWLVEGGLECDFERGVEQLTRVFVNGLGLRERASQPRPRRLRSGPAEAVAGRIRPGR